MADSSQNQKIIDGVVVLSEFDADTLPVPPADKTYLYAEDDGSGNTVLKTRDSSGTEREIAFSAPLTNSEINDGIADDPEATRAEIGAFGKVSYSGLTLTVSAGYLLAGDGSKITHNEITVTLRASMTQYIVLNPWSLSLHALKRHIGTSDILVAIVSTNSSEVTAIAHANPTKLNPTRIPRFLGKMKRSDIAKYIDLLGDSLTNGTSGGGILWRQSNFDSAQAARGYNIPNLATTTVTNYAIGGMSARWGITLLGSAMGNGSGVNVGYPLNGYARDKISAQYGTEVNASDTPLKIGFPGRDLAIIMFGANVMDYNLGFIEAAVKTLSDSGTEGLICTSNQTQSDPTFLESAGPYLREIADIFNWELVDDWAYANEAIAKGVPYFADNIHPDQTGSDSKATAIRGPLHEHPVEAISNKFGPRIRSIRAQNSTYNTRFPADCDMIFIPTTTTGATIAATTTIGQETTRNPAIATGARNSTNCVTELTVGEYAVFAHPHFQMCDLLVETDSSFTVSIKTQAGTTIRSGISHSTNSNGLAIIEGVRFSDVDTWPGIPAALATIYSAAQVGINSGLQIETTSGTCKLVGIIFYRPKRITIPLEEIIKIGTWSYEAGGVGMTRTTYTDTSGDYALIRGYGDGFQILLSARSGAGIINTKLNGVVLNTNADLYTNGNNIFPLNRGGIGYGEKVIKIIYTGNNNASAGATSSGDRRLGIGAAWIFDNR